MSDNSSGGGNGNSWTILTPEVKESGAESIGPLSDPQGSPAPSDAVQLHTKQSELDISQGSKLTDEHMEQCHALEQPQVTPLDVSAGASPVHVTHVKDEQIPGRVVVENLTSLTSDSGEPGTSDERSDSEAVLHPDTDSFADSYTYITPSTASPKLPGESQEGDELSHEEKKDELRKTLGEEFKPSLEESEEKDNDGDGLRRRNISLVTSLDHRGDEEEEEEEEEEPFRPPQREEGVGLSLNKCIFGAVVLLTLGTIFFSGALMDLDDEGDTEVTELKDTELKKEWLHSEAPGNIAADPQPPEILENLATDNQRDPDVQVNLEQQEDASKAAQMQVEEDSMENIRSEEVELENQRMKGELERRPAPQKELEQESELVKKGLEALPDLQKELELLKAKVAELSQHADRVQVASAVSDSTPPTAGQDGRSPTSQEQKELKDKKTKEKGKNKKEQKKGKERKEGEKDKTEKFKDEKPRKQKEGEKKGWKAEKHWEKEKISQEEEGKEWRGRGERKEWKGEKDGKSGTKREHGKSGKDREENREYKEGSEKREWKEDKKRQREKPWALDGGKWETKEGKDAGDKAKEGKAWKHSGEQKEKREKEWKKDKQDRWKDENEWKDKGKYKKKDWEEGDEQYGEKVRNPKGDQKYAEKERQEKKWKGEKDDYKRSGGKQEWKQWEETQKSRRGRDEWPEDGERTEGWKEEKKRKENHHKKEKVNKDSKEHLYSEQKSDGFHKHNDYWSQQRERIRHYRGSTEGCSGVTGCAHAEGISPVSQGAFDSFLLGYLSRLDGSEEQASKNDKLKKLAGEFFSNGVFVHDQIPFSEFVEDVEDILEDMIEEEDDGREDEMEGFAREAMQKFVLSDRGEGTRSESGRKRAMG